MTNRIDSVLPKGRFLYEEAGRPDISEGFILETLPSRGLVRIGPVVSGLADVEISGPGRWVRTSNVFVLHEFDKEAKTDSENPQ